MYTQAPNVRQFSNNRIITFSLKAEYFYGWGEHFFVITR